MRTPTPPLSDYGLSPRLRGNLPLECGFPIGFRSIPALAGEPVTPSPVRISVTVYPRACGGTNTKEEEDRFVVGLSPRLRGNLIGGTLALDCQRSIPALAGEPRRALAPLGNVAVYPRACGGTTSPARVRSMVRGLSPRLRGNHRLTACAGSGARSIPALAGEPKLYYTFTRSYGVYPRACGGTARRGFLVDADLGLSPRLRGNPAAARAELMGIRSIPALAGEPSVRIPRAVSSEVYPRACGGTSSKWLA